MNAGRTTSAGAVASNPAWLMYTSPSGKAAMRSASADAFDVPLRSASGIAARAEDKPRHRDTRRGLVVGTSDSEDTRRRATRGAERHEAQSNTRRGRVPAES